MDIDHVKTSGDLLLEAHFHPHTRSAEHALGTIIWIHGAFEHQGRYEHVIHDFQERGFQSISFDLRGQGRSRGTRMFIETEADYLDDVSAVVNHYRDKMAGPLILFGHSMGGLVAIRFHQERRAELPHHASTITSAPFLGVAAPVPGWKKSLSKIVVGIYPKLSVPADLDSTHISHDPEVVKAYDNDPLVNTKATAGWFEAILEAQQQALRMASTTAGPLHMLQAGEDYLVSNAAQDTFFNALPSDVRKTKTVYDGLYHELLQEPEREEVMGQIRRLIQEDAALEPEA